MKGGDRGGWGGEKGEERRRGRRGKGGHVRRRDGDERMWMDIDKCRLRRRNERINLHLNFLGFEDAVMRCDEM